MGCKYRKHNLIPIFHLTNQLYLLQRTPEGSSNSLNQLTAPVHEWNDCMRIWNRNGPSFVCKAVIDGRDTVSWTFLVITCLILSKLQCSGDSGSPLVIGTGAHRVQVAVVSFGTSVSLINENLSLSLMENWILIGLWSWITIRQH